jgi:RimJ/RimL family protein N-acetyltransferase
MAEQRTARLPLRLGDLTVRQVRLEDAADVLEYRSNPEVARQQYWEPFTAERVETLLANLAHVEPGRIGVPLMLVAEYGGEVIGDFPLTVNIPEHAQGEVGFSFHPGYTGQGLATRALTAVLGFGFLQLDLHRITAATFTENERAWRLMERVGMRREAHFIHDGFVRGRWMDVYGYGMLADEWRERHAGLVVDVAP